MHHALERKHYIRTQAELLARIMEAIGRGDEGDEFNEYMKQAKFIPLELRALYEDVEIALWRRPESIESITQVAKNYLPFMLKAINRQAMPKYRSIVTLFRAWKWMLGHDDADTFMLIQGGNGEMHPLYVYEELNQQIITGSWDRQTKAAQMKESEN
jgi:hypothetical protein